MRSKKGLSTIIVSGIAMILPVSTYIMSTQIQAFSQIPAASPVTPPNGYFTPTPTCKPVTPPNPSVTVKTTPTMTPKPSKPVTPPNPSVTVRPASPTPTVKQTRKPTSTQPVSPPNPTGKKRPIPTPTPKYQGYPFWIRLLRWFR